MCTAIKVENLSKIYQLGQIGTKTLSKDIERWWTTRVRGKEDPFLKIGETNTRDRGGESDIVFSLKDINLEIKEGEAVGIIGRNGAGKSTLLKILSRVTSPTTGKINIRGRVASLLEVGTGFHPELSGRENIYLNGAILGMRKKEIDRKFDEIVDFSGVERYIETPVKRYSSGMYVRLAFAVAAHLESEILIVDEVLAVGDAEFQKKCLGRMKDVSTNEGRTVLFVSHNMSAVKELCDKGVLLNNGQISFSGTTGEVIKEYLLKPIMISSPSDFLKDPKSRRGNGEARFTEISVNNGMTVIDPTEEVRLKFRIMVLKDIPSVYFTFAILGSDNNPLTSSPLTPLSETSLNSGSELEFELIIARNTFRAGFFPLYLWIGKKGDLASENYHYDCIDGLFHLNFVSDKNKNELGYDPLHPGGVFNMDYHLGNKIFS